MTSQITAVTPSTIASARTTISDPIAALELLANEVSRAILTTLSDTPMTASEISERADLPLSTVYRHLDDLKAHNFITQTIRFDGSGIHPTQFSRDAFDLEISIGDGLSAIISSD